MAKELSKDAKAMRNAYYKKYRAEHKDQIKGYQAKYWEKKAQELKEAEEVQG